MKALCSKLLGYRAETLPSRGDYGVSPGNRKFLAAQTHPLEDNTNQGVAPSCSAGLLILSTVLR